MVTFIFIILSGFFIVGWHNINNKNIIRTFGKCTVSKDLTTDVVQKNPWDPRGK